MMWFGFAALALVIENLCGYPKFLQDSIGHPVEWIGRFITLLDKKLNTPTSDQADGRLNGIAALFALVLAAGAAGALITYVLAHIPGGWFINILIATTLIAQKSMRDHIHTVQHGLGTSLAKGRIEVAKIVGRDPDQLDEAGVAKAALESLAENTSDGIVAPALWYAIGGLPALLIYKAVNTADSMIGHKSEKYVHFGWASARFDDLINLPASRLTGAIFATVALIQNQDAGKSAWEAMWRDASKHQSPNAGWPESAMAGALGLTFGGPRNYGGETIDLPTMGDGRMQIERTDIERGLKLYDQSMFALAALFGLIALIISASSAILPP